MTSVFRKIQDMGSITFRPVVYSQYRRRDGAYAVRIRVTANRKSRYITTNVSVTQEQMTKSLKIRDRAVLDRLDALVREMRAAAAELDPFVLEKMDIDEVVRFLGRERQGTFRLEFFAFAEKIIEGKEKKNTRNYYRNALLALKRYTGRDRMDISEVTSSLMRGFDAWLTGEYGEHSRAASAYTAGIASFHAQARRMYNNEETGEILIRNPFAYFHPRKERRVPHRNVSKEAIQALIDGRRRLTSRAQARAVDHFLMSFALMGMNAADIYEAAPPEDGVITYFRAKTRDRRDDRAEMHVRIEPQVATLYERLKDWSGKRAFDVHNRISPETFAHTLTADLARACGTLGIQEHLTFYSARHSWATLAYRAGVDKSVINDCLCHVDESMRITDVYIAKSWEVMWEANEKVLALFDWSKI